MRHQTNQEFLWMIWTDPSLNKQLLQELVDSVRDFPNVVIVGNTNLVNEDFRQSVNGLLGTPLGGKKKKLKKTKTTNSKNKWDDSIILHGSRELLLDYYVASQERILLETRLDADDALTGHFLETVQTQAVQALGSSRRHKDNNDTNNSDHDSDSQNNDYRVWCANQFVDWRYYAPGQEKFVERTSRILRSRSVGSNNSRSERGFLSPEEDLRGCVSVGLTMGFQVGASVDQLPTKEHHRIRESLPACPNNEYDDLDVGNSHNNSHKTTEHIKRCVVGLTEPQGHFLALRARTPTSTSMVNVVSSSTLATRSTTAATAAATTTTVDQAQQLLWDTMERDFDIQAPKVWELRNRFQAHLPDILVDAIAGLCKAGHSCRQSSKDILYHLLKDAVAEAAQKGR